jgi:hypothetical protein
MKIDDAIRTSLRGVRQAKVRSILTMLGIVIGIASVILLMSIGASAQQLILDQVKNVGSNLIFVIPGGPGGRGIVRFIMSGRLPSIFSRTRGSGTVSARARRGGISSPSS